MKSPADKAKACRVKWRAGRCPTPGLHRCDNCGPLPLDQFEVAAGRWIRNKCKACQYRHKNQQRAEAKSRRQEKRKPPVTAGHSMETEIFALNAIRHVSKAMDAWDALARKRIRHSSPSERTSVRTWPLRLLACPDTRLIHACGLGA